MKAVVAALVVLCSASAAAAPNVANVTQKGSLLIFPDIDVRGGSTLVRLQNDGTQDVDVKCFWMDGNKNRVDFVLPVTRNQPVWFDAASGNGTFQVNPFPRTPANGLDNPYLLGPTQPPIQVTVAAGPVQTFGTTTTVTTSAVAPTTLAMNNFGTFQFGFESVQVNFGAWLGPPNTSATLNGTLTRNVTISGVTRPVSQTFTLVLADYNGILQSSLNVDAADPVTFPLPDGRVIIYTAFGGGAGVFAPGPRGIGLNGLFELVNPEVSDNADPYGAGLLACWAVDAGGQQQVKWNHLSGTATYYDQQGAYSYEAYALRAPLGLDLEPVGVAGVINLDGVDYESCPLYQIGQFTPIEPLDGFPLGAIQIGDNRLVTAACSLDLRQDYTPTWTKLQFDLWNEDEVKFTGAFDCADSWHETFFDNDVDAGAQNFGTAVLGSATARYRVQGVGSSQCRGSQGVGLLAVQATGAFVGDGPSYSVGTTLAAAGKTNGRINWDPAGAVPEGGIR